MGRKVADPKRCIRCNEQKPRSEFSAHATSKGGVQSHCKPCAAELSRTRNARDPQKLDLINRRSKLKRAYGITLEQYDELLKQQSGCCAICGTSDPKGKSGQFGPVFHVDHCHTTGVIRGLLCSKCNTGLGNFGDSKAKLLNAINYLKGERFDYSSGHL